MNVISTPSMPEYIQKVDIMFMDVKDEYGSWDTMFSGNSNDHCAMYLGPNEGDGYQFIESSSIYGVQTRSFSSFFSYYENMTYYRVVNASSDEIDDAIDFVKDQIGSSYQNLSLGIRKIADPGYPHATADMWYCSELIWAGYYDAGVDIDQNGWSIIPWGVPAVPIGCPLGSCTNDITEDEDVRQLPIYD